MSAEPGPRGRRAGNGRAVWTVDEVRALGVTTDVPTAGEVLGIGRTLAFELFRKGEFPVPVLRIGRRVIVPVSGLLQLLDVAASAGGEAGSGRAARIS